MRNKGCNTENGQRCCAIHGTIVIAKKIFLIETTRRAEKRGLVPGECSEQRIPVSQVFQANRKIFMANAINNLPTASNERTGTGSAVSKASENGHCPRKRKRNIFMPITINRSLREFFSQASIAHSNYYFSSREHKILRLGIFTKTSIKPLNHAYQSVQNLSLLAQYISDEAV